MELIKTEWLGRWDSFETYIESTDPAMQQCWEEAQNTGRPFPGGVKAFWSMACATKNGENPHQIAGWEVTETETGIAIEWFAANGESLSCFHYAVVEIAEKGLEGKENFLFCAENATEGSPFAYVLAMEPMPEREAVNHGGYLSHLHFQFASSRSGLLTEEVTLQNVRWYATMCASSDNLLHKCNLVRGLHKLPKWETIPQS